MNFFRKIIKEWRCKHNLKIKPGIGKYIIHYSCDKCGMYKIKDIAGPY